MTPADIDALVGRLRSFGEAYPEDVFGPVTEQEIKDHASLITRNSAAMGRHCAKFMLEAAAALAALKADAERYRHLRLSSEFKIDRRHGLKFDGSLCGETLDRHVDESRVAAREEKP